jgi:hypothetical protein
VLEPHSGAQGREAVELRAPAELSVVDGFEARERRSQRHWQ